MLEELKQEEKKYRNLYDLKTQKHYILDGLKADCFKLAITRVENKGLKDTYLFIKDLRDKFSQSTSKIGSNLANAYNLVLGKMWKYYKQLKK